VTPGLTFTGTINPDFDRLEADPAVVQLTLPETFLPRSAPFFVEGSGTFTSASIAMTAPARGCSNHAAIGADAAGHRICRDDDGRLLLTRLAATSSARAS